jgi:ornithine carbamoyltransferase
MPKRDFLAISDLTPPELDTLFTLARQMKRGEYRERPLAGQSIALIFGKSSTRTRVSFEVGVHQLGGHPLYLSSRELQLGRGEPTRDTARVLSRYVDGIMIRTYAHTEVEELARFASVPVINGLTDLMHPCQVLADVMTLQEAFGSWRERIVAWVGDGNNMANSWIDAATTLGFELRIACPSGYEPNAELVRRATGAGTRLTVLQDPVAAVAGAHVVTTDVWASMGEEAEADERRQDFAGFTVDDALMQRADREAIFLHCLPAHRGEEVTEAVLEGPQSRVWDEAENRLHIQKALMAVLMGRNGE